MLTLVASLSTASRLDDANVRLALESGAFDVVDHRCEGCVTVYEEPAAPTPVELPPASYYVGGVTAGQRAVYDEHCEERFAERSPYHYSSAAEVEQKDALAGGIWRRRTVYQVQRGFVAFDGLVVQPPERDGAAATAASRRGRLYVLERLPGFNGLGRLMIALDSLGAAAAAERVR